MPQHPTRSTLSRRTFLGAAGGASIALGANLLGGPTAAAVEPTGGSFDLTAGSHPFLEGALTADTHHTMQSFCFDPNNQRLFTIAQPNGGTTGELAVTRMSYSGTVNGHMKLGKLGHGVSMAAERSGTDTYLWTEWNYDAATDRGRGVQRFKFVDGATSASPTYRGNPTADEGGVNVTPSVDHWNRLLALKYAAGGQSRFRVYDLDRASAGDFSQVLVQCTQPPLDGTTFQGWTIFGGYAYLLCGRAYNDDKTSPDYNPVPGDTTLSKLNLATGRFEQTLKHTDAFGSMVSREPEGMAGYIKADGEHRLYFGFVGHSGAKSSSQPDGIDRPISIAYKNVFG